MVQCPQDCDASEGVSVKFDLYTRVKNGSNDESWASVETATQIRSFGHSMKAATMRRPEWEAEARPWERANSEDRVKRELEVKVNWLLSNCGAACQVTFDSHDFRLACIPLPYQDIPLF